MTFSLITTALIALTLNASAGPVNQYRQDYSSNKRETMKNVLYALEEGTEYDSTPYWREYDYGLSLKDLDLPDLDFDFNWDFPEIRINEDFIDDMNRKLESLEGIMNEKLRQLEIKIDSLNRRISRSYDGLV